MMNEREFSLFSFQTEHLSSPKTENRFINHIAAFITVSVRLSLAVASEKMSFPDRGVVYAPPDMMFHTRR
jgi:hypothetical protein